MKLDISLTIGRFRVGWETPLHVLNKHLWSRFNNELRVKYELNRMKKLVINVNNFCNLDCFSCVSMCDKPFDTPWRDEAREMDPDDVDVALHQILKYDRYEGVTLAGGEPTAMNLDKLKAISEVVRAHGLKSHVLTNGYKITHLDPFDFDYITLDDHGTNTPLIIQAKYFLESQGFERYFINSALVHRDFNEARKTPVTTPGVLCSGWLQPTLWLDVVYPCCGMPQMEGWDNDTILRDALRRDGWTTKNPDLSDVLRNWRQTIPPEVIKKCLFSCWKYRKSYIEKNIVEERMSRA